jgi:class 3 adenylate cyclase
LESGTVSAIILWSFLTPIAVSLIAAREERYILVWLAAYVMVVLSAYLFAPALGNSSLYATDIIVNSMLPFNLALFTCVLTLALYYSVRHRAEMDQLRKHQYFNLHEQHTQLNSANARKDLLLSTVLPERIGKRLLDKHEMIADGHSDVAVMFVDIVGFTKLTETMSPKQIVRLLDNLFSGFDEIADRYGLEKIKTIGDAYLAVGGLSNQDNGDYVEATVKTAQGFQDHIREQTKEQFHGNALDIHIGIATGPIAAGVIGKIRLTYDIWGNTVNLASRLVDHASAGQILVDQITYKRISKKFDFAQEPLLTLKGGSQVNVYRLLNSGALHHAAEGGNVVQLHA